VSKNTKKNSKQTRKYKQAQKTMGVMVIAMSGTEKYNFKNQPV